MTDIDTDYRLYCEALTAYTNLIEQLWKARDTNSVTPKLEHAVKHGRTANWILDWPPSSGQLPHAVDGTRNSVHRKSQSIRNAGLRPNASLRRNA